jgi:sialate O-acetylesterase
MLRKSMLTAIAASLLWSAGLAARAAQPPRPFVHPLFSDHAVLQRDVQLPVWGWTELGQTVHVALGGKTAEATADADGRWQATVGPFAAGGPYVLEVSGPRKLTVNDVLIGDVWICSGQSNMEMGIANCNAQADIDAAGIPQLRLLTVPRLVAGKPVPVASVAWLPSSPTNVKKGIWGGFSAAGFYFGRELHKELKIPIGLIHTSWGGTLAEAWTSEEGLKPLADFQGRLKQLHAGLRAEPPRFNAGDPNVSTVLYNGMIAPLVPLAIKGAIWYQGESNAGRAWQYRTLLPAMIQDWRAHFGVGDFPFYIVQLAAWQQSANQPRENDWAELREAQALTAQKLPNCGLAVAIDIGDAGDIHPKDKLDVGRRLALCALANAYGKPIEWSGPWYKSMEAAGKAIRLHFAHVGDGLVAKGDKLQGFAVAGEDRKFVWAEAAIEGDTVLVSSPKVAHPVAVRYAWDINPVCNLFNQEGLPAVPFRTDNWPAITAKNK